jgi:hypothetical protein
MKRLLVLNQLKRRKKEAGGHRGTMPEVTNTPETPKSKHSTPFVRRLAFRGDYVDFWILGSRKEVLTDFF